MKEQQTETLQRILEAATDVFAEVGYAGARVDEIAKRANINKAALYYHIGGKKEIYDVVLQNLLGQAVESIIKQVQEAETPEEKLTCYIRTLAENIERNPAVAPIMLREVALSGENLSETFIKTLLRLMAALVEIFDEGETQGVFEPAPPLIIHFMIVGAILLFRVKESIMIQNASLTKAMQLVSTQFSGQATDELGQLIMKNFKLFSGNLSNHNIAEEIEKLVLKAVKK